MSNIRKLPGLVQIGEASIGESVLSSQSILFCNYTHPTGLQSNVQTVSLKPHYLI